MLTADAFLQVVTSTAEALAKAQYAATKDPHSCALMYTALQRKALLTVGAPGRSAA